jgi:cardiolipin synthase
MNLANLISLGRLLSIPILIWMILTGMTIEAFIVFVISGASDAIDGFVARYFKSRTTLGACLDPIADKALLISVYGTLGYKGLIPLWLVIIVIFRDLLIVGGVLFLFIMRQKIHIKALLISKINTVLQIGAVTCVLAFSGFNLIIPYLNQALFILVAISTILSGASYVRVWIRQFV